MRFKERIKEEGGNARLELSMLVLKLSVDRPLDLARLLHQLFHTPASASPYLPRPKIEKRERTSLRSSPCG